MGALSACWEGAPGRAALLEQETQVGAQRRPHRKDQSEDHRLGPSVPCDGSSRQVLDAMLGVLLLSPRHVAELQWPGTSRAPSTQACFLGAARDRASDLSALQVSLAAV